MTKTTASYESSTIQQLIDDLKRLNTEKQEQNAAWERKNLELQEELADARALAKFYYNFIIEKENKA